MDIKALDPAGRVCNREVQVKYYPGGSHEKRVVFHGCRILSKQLNKNEDFSKVRSVVVIFFNFESASDDFIRDIALRDGKGVMYSDLIRLYEVNTMESAGATEDQQFVKIFSFFLLYACDKDKFFAKLAEEGIDHENETVNMLLRVYEALIGNEQVKGELKIMEITTEDGIFLATRNFADVHEKGIAKGLNLKAIQAAAVIVKKWHASIADAMESVELEPQYRDQVIAELRRQGVEYTEKM